MDKRIEVRLDYVQIKPEISNVSIICKDNFALEAKLENLSSCGMMLSIKATTNSIKYIPHKNDTVEINIENSITILTVTGTCMYTNINPDGNVLIGMNVVSAQDQNKLHAIVRGQGG